MKRRRAHTVHPDLMGVCPDGLLCAVALRPRLIPRNRYFSLYTEPRARRAHGSAYALRRLYAEVARLLDDANINLSVTSTDLGVRIAYRDEALALRRKINLGSLETALLRVLLARSGVSVPPVLRVVPQDRARIRAALRRLRSHPGLARALHERE